MNNNRKKGYLFLVLPLAIGFFLFLDTQVRVRQLWKETTTASVRFLKPEEEEKESYVSGQELNRIAEKKQETLLEMTAFTKDKNVLLRDEDLRRPANAAHYIVWGNMYRVLPVPLLYGNYCYGLDKYGCVIDKGTAYALYGSLDVVDMILIHEGKRYFIRGILDTDVPVFMTQGLDLLQRYDNLEILFDDKEEGKSATEKLLVENGHMDNYVLVEGRLYAKWLQHIVSAPPWIFFMVFFLYLARMALQKGRSRRTRILTAFMGCFLVVMGAGLLLSGVIENPLYLPERFVPSRFSNFSFWTEKAKEMKEWYNQLVYMAPYPKEVLLFRSIRILLIETGVFLCAAIWFAARLKQLEKFEK